MNKILLSPPGKRATKIAEPGKKSSNAKISTLYTSDMNLVSESTTIIKPPKLNKSEENTKPLVTKSLEFDKFTILRKYAPSTTSNDDIYQILNLKYVDGNFIIDENHKDIIIEIIGMLNIYSIDYILDFLDESPNKEWIFWDQKFMNVGKVSVEREIFINRAEEIGVKGVGKCRYCPGTELVFAQKQVNSGDEPMKVYVRCVTCGQHWKQG